jgi:DNA-binding GntR family transcriptional regulator
MGRVPHGSRPDQVYAALRELIVDGQVAAGERIIETDIAARLGVSRTPVREALQRLQQEGFVTAAPAAHQSRLSVAPLTRADMRELLAIVGALEGLGAVEAAQLPPDQRHRLAGDLRRLNDDFGGVARRTPDDHAALHRADEHFHRHLMEAAGGPRLLALHAAIKPQAERYVRMYVSMLTGDLRASLSEHEAIAAAVATGQGREAQQAVETNWRHAADRLARVINASGAAG